MKNYNLTKEEINTIKVALMCYRTDYVSETNDVPEYTKYIIKLIEKFDNEE